MTDNTISFRTHDQKVLWDLEIRGQLSDGHWENTTPHNHWQCWSRAKTTVDPGCIGRNFRVSKDNYNLTDKDLLNVIAGRMIVYVKAARLVGQDNVETLNHCYDFCSDTWHGLPESSRYIGEYWDNIRAKITALAAANNVDIEGLHYAMDGVKYDRRDLVRDLKEIMRTIRFYNEEVGTK